MTDTTRGGFVAFGELMLSLTPRDHERLVQARAFEARYTGAEANVAVALAGLGIPAAVVSRVPEHEIGQACLNYLRQFGVDVTHVRRGGDRLGLLYVEQGVAQRPTSVIYDRAHTSFSEAAPDAYDWDAVLTGRGWLHWSGTAPSRGPNIVACIERACEAAHRLGITVSCDVNYRSRLWSVADAAPVMARLLERVDVAFVGADDARQLLGIEAVNGDAAGTAQQVRERFGLRAVVSPVRQEDGSGASLYGATLCTADGTWGSAMHRVATLGRIGAGDALAAGVIYGMLLREPPQRIVDLGAATACLKHTLPGDFATVTAAEVEAVISGRSGGRLLR